MIQKTFEQFVDDVIQVVKGYVVRVIDGIIKWFDEFEKRAFVPGS